MKNRARLLLLLLLFLAFQATGLSAALSADTPALTWERGRQQTITLGGDTASKFWKLTLVDATGKSLPFIRSSSNAAGFFIYSIDLADELREGNYQIMTQGPELGISLVANVEVIPITNYNPREDPRGVGAFAVIAFTVLFLLSARSQPAEEPADLLGAGGQDKWSFGGLGIVASLDHARFFAYGHAAKKSKLMTRILVDGAYLQSLFGIFSLLLPIAGLAFGISMGLTSDLAKSLVPISLALFLVIIVIAILDSFSGAIALAAFALCALFQGQVNSLVELQTLLGLFFIAFTPILAACVTRPLRRGLKRWSLWQRVGDVLSAALLTGWAVKALVMALDGFSHQKNPIAMHSNLAGIVAGAVIVLRYLLEQLALGFTGNRLSFLTRLQIPEEKLNRFLQLLLIKAGIFLLFCYGFLGFSWQTFVATIILVLPLYLVRYSSNFPNLPMLFQIVPRRLPAVIFLSLAGFLLNNWINSLPLVASDKSKMLVIILSLPAFLLSLLQLLGRHPAEKVIT